MPNRTGYNTRPTSSRILGQNPKSLSEKVAAGVPPAVEVRHLAVRKNRSLGGNGWFYQVDGAATLFPPGGTRRLYVSQDGRRYHQTRSKGFEALIGRQAVKILKISSCSDPCSLPPRQRQLIFFYCKRIRLR